MKNVLFIILFSISTGAYSQKYIPFPKDSAEWFVEGELIDGDGGPSTFRKDRLFVAGDTIVNDTSFIKLFVEKPSIIYLIGLLYQDTIYERVYLNKNYGQNSELLFDFKLQEGQNFLFSGADRTVETVDFISINGVNRKRITFDTDIRCGSHFEKLWFIEGIGSNAGPYPLNYLGILVSVLTCYNEEGESIYRLNLNEQACDLNTIILSKKDIPIIKKTSVYPNPFYEDIIIESKFLEKELITIKLINLLGQIEFTKTFRFSEINKFDVSSLNKGFYFLTIENENLVLMSTKVIKL